VDGNRAEPHVRPADVAGLFIEGARVVAAAIGDPLVAQAWDQPSVLEDQRVSSLAGHLARGGVWVVGDYLDAGRPAGPVDLHSAGQYFAAFVSTASPSGHQAIRDRGAAVASAGRDELLRGLGERLAALEPRIRTADRQQLIAVAGGKVMRLEDYLATRIVEQTVHLDDLARSVGREAWQLPAGAEDLVVPVEHQHGSDGRAKRKRGEVPISVAHLLSFAHRLGRYLLHTVTYRRASS